MVNLAPISFDLTHLHHFKVSQNLHFGPQYTLIKRIRVLDLEAVQIISVASILLFRLIVGKVKGIGDFVPQFVRVELKVFALGIA